MARFGFLLGVAALAATAAPVAAQPAAAARTKSVVLVHGAFVDGSGWQPVYERLVRDGYKVSVVQNPLTDFATDVAYAKRAVADADGPVVLVGHSYGGAVVTEAGADPKVAAIVYVAAFAPDAGESITTLAQRPAAGAAPPPYLPPEDGKLRIDPAKFPAAFAGGVSPALARFMATAQAPFALASAGGKVSAPAWRTKPSWYLLTTQDRMIPPETQRFMAKRANAVVTEVAASHSVFLTRPDAVVAIIEKAAQGR